MDSSKIKSVVVVANPKKKWAQETRQSVIAYLKSKGIRIESNGGKADLAVLIGGDGTILFNKAHYNKMLFGIGTKTSFICQGLRHNWKARLSKFLANPKTSSRLCLSAKLNGQKLPLALNDVAIKTRDHRIVRIRLAANCKKFDFSADGAIFSTPTGSSAYAYSCGGAEMNHESQDYQIVAIAPYRRAFKPIIVNGDSKSSCSIESECDVDVIVDGQSVFHAKNGMRLSIARNKKPVLFAKV